MNEFFYTVLACIFIGIAGILTLCCISSCMLSSQISREEERQRNQEDLCHQNENLNS